MILNNLPNALTLTRFILIAPFLMYLHQANYTSALYVFIAAGLTDGFDGWLARTFQWQSRFGSFLDPLADKLLIASSFVSLAFMKQLPWWLVILVFCRDVTISLGVLTWHRFVPQQRIEFKPTMLSKINTALQLGLVIFCLTKLAFAHTIPHATTLTYVLIGLTSITTTTSYVDYFWTGAKQAFASTPTPQ